MPTGNTSGNSGQSDSTKASEASTSSIPAGRRGQLNENIRKAVLLVGAVLVLVAAGLGWWNDKHNTPDKVFTNAISKLLSTKTVVQTVKSNTASISVAYDATNVKDPRVNMAIEQVDSSQDIKVNGYGSLQNEYLKYTSFGSTALDSSLKSLVGKWVQIRTNGTIAPDANADAKTLADPRYLMFGDFLMGNFSSGDRQRLLQFIAANKVYSYDVKHVTTATVNGRNAYVYSLTENAPKLKELNEKVAAIMGISAADIQPALAQASRGSGTTKLYVDEGTKEIVGYTNTLNGATVTGSYTNYDTTSLPKQPKADLTWAQFVQKEAALASQPAGTDSL